MIRPLRRAHRRVVLALGIVVPLVLAAALWLRPAVPVQTEWLFR